MTALHIFSALMTIFWLQTLLKLTSFLSGCLIQNANGAIDGEPEQGPPTARGQHNYGRR